MMECIAEIMYIHTKIKTRVTHKILVLITEPILKGTQFRHNNNLQALLKAFERLFTSEEQMTVYYCSYFFPI